jgi:hypothetical protein
MELSAAPRQQAIYLDITREGQTFHPRPEITNGKATAAIDLTPDL